MPTLGYLGNFTCFIEIIGDTALSWCSLQHHSHSAAMKGVVDILWLPGQVSINNGSQIVEALMYQPEHIGLRYRN